MPLLTSASVHQIQTILDLFPITTLKEEWDIKGLKDEICLEIAGTKNRNEISTFIHDNLNVCKQHVYVFQNNSDLQDALELSLPDSEKINEAVTDSGVIKTFLSKHRVEIVLLTEQTQRKTVEFILPLQIIYSDEYIILRFVIFERNFHTFYKGIEVLPLRKRDNREEEMIKAFMDQAISSRVRIHRADLHKGIKTLWENDWMDSCKIKYKDADSTNAKNMNENKGIKASNPTSYDEIKDHTLYNCYFTTSENDGKLPVSFTADASEGYIAFTSYSKNFGDYDYVVEEILKHNS